ncbi:hypothetical protein CONCODRAFT_153755 [Conidiobolus coronatus NRRL 28638]|uniref:Uncharacterized protein n=1 Tax=Conidiobolus coronatus (strain ATCC 28846 / CBS 209.66 / NRRL 28638) TaxID=796925 RepID=A0A137NQ55_CONC2|nr:hypothetical protein CONCODRAFT_153755 [Conidiobolus coronatus NRRL 28638]|eukprot:KXN64895.1 hypothetical protein CONCODRAFT_153755 [Conidiobolus coronatus NRRL 28638]
MENKDGREIYYHGALYKQLADSSELSKFTIESIDFVLYFNSDLVYWFEGDGNIEANQPNFLLVAANELIKGLGAYVSIVGYGYDGLFFSPGHQIILGDSAEIVKNIGFDRYILDSLLVTTSDNKSINSLLDPYFDFESGIMTLPFKDLIPYLKNTTLIEASKKIEKLATTPDSLAIKLPSGNSLVLETSVQPYDRSRSIRFISESKYLHTKEALLTSKVIYGEEPLPQGKPEDWPTYPYGPLLIETLELMGYTLKDSYKNSVATSTSSKDGTKENNKSGNNSSNFKVNFGLLAALISFYLLS